MEDIKSLEQKQIEYYQARASEYDEWFFRKGRYDHGEELNRQWFLEVEQVRASLEDFRPEGRVLELACGTGLWTQQLLKYSQQITAVDAVPEVIAINQQRLHSAHVNYIQANIFHWAPEAKFDVVFFGFWLSHVASQYFRPFWGMVANALAPGGRVFFVDSKFDQNSTAIDHKIYNQKSGIVKRRLNDGREYQIVKIFYESKLLEKQLIDLSWNVTVEETSSYFIYGFGNNDSKKECAQYPLAVDVPTGGKK